MQPSSAPKNIPAELVESIATRFGGTELGFCEVVPEGQVGVVIKNTDYERKYLFANPEVAREFRNQLVVAHKSAVEAETFNADAYNKKFVCGLT